MLGVSFKISNLIEYMTTSEMLESSGVNEEVPNIVSMSFPKLYSKFLISENTQYIDEFENVYIRISYQSQMGNM